MGKQSQLKSNQTESVPSSPKMNLGRPRKEEKLFGRRNWESITQPSTSYDQEEVHSSSLPRSIKPKRSTVDNMYHDLEAQSVVMARAKEIEATLSPSHPSLIKVMLPSHVTGGFWLSLPKGFCDNHLPKQDTTMVLEDESGIEYHTKFISERTGLSAGWRGFSIAHKLLQGDVLIFHLVMPNKFMVYIVRSNVVAEIDGALGLGFEACNKQTPLYSEEYIPHIKEEQMTLDDGNGKETNIAPIKEEENSNHVSRARHIHKEHEQTSSHVHLDTKMLPVLEEPKNVKSFGSNYRNGIRISDYSPDFDKVKRFNDFNISVNGLIMDSEISSHTRTKYYENGKETNIAPEKGEGNENLASLATHIHRRKEQTSSHVRLDSEKLPVLGESENDKSFGSNSMNGIPLSDSTPDFDKVERSNNFNISVNGLIMGSEFSSHMRTKHYENGKKTNIAPVKEEENDNLVFLATHIHSGKEQISSHVHLDSEKLPMLGESENDRSYGSNSMNEIRLSDSTLDFDKVKGLNDFNISVNGLTIDFEFSSQVRTKYYELCCSQSSFLHDHILEGLNYKLVLEIITETINIADAIRSCTITTSQDHLTNWDKTLMAFESLGMNVGFLRARIYQLLMISLKPEKRREAELKRECTQQEICILNAKIMDARATIKQLEAEIHYLDADVENMEKLFAEVAGAPW